MIRVILENKTQGTKYSYLAKSQKQANAWVNWIQVDDEVTKRNCPNCQCHLVITVKEEDPS